jgi:hypothetical protein
MRSFVTSATALAIFAAGCGSGTEPVAAACAAILPTAVTLRFTDVQSGQFIGAGTRVTATGPGSSLGPAVDAISDTSHVYIYGYPGTYEITSDKSGYSKRTDRINVLVRNEACNTPKLVDTTLTLTRSTIQ